MSAFTDALEAKVTSLQTDLSAVVIAVLPLLALMIGIAVAWKFLKRGAKA